MPGTLRIILLALAVVVPFLGHAPTSAVPLPTEEAHLPGCGAVTGRVTYDGTPPEPQDLTPQINSKEVDAPHCKKGPTTAETWVVGGAGNGVANVIVWMRAPKGEPFKIHEKLRTRSDTVRIDQPFCVFVPHVFVLFPSYFDPETGTQKPTGQTFKVANSAPIAHNAIVDFSDAIVNPMGGNVLMPPNAKDMTIEARPCKSNAFGGEQSVRIMCNIHPWMAARGRIFDHPFVSITRGASAGDKDFGTYRIANIPAGMDLELVYWHESMSAPKVLKKVTLKERETVVENFKIAR